MKDESADFPVVYISFPSSKDPDWQNKVPKEPSNKIIPGVEDGIFWSDED